jgi:type I restriction enzyme S subunit
MINSTSAKANMANGWQTFKIGELVTQNHNGVTVAPDKTYKLLGVRLEGRGAFLREEKSGDNISAKTLNPVRAGDFIYSRLFAWRGAFGVVSDEMNGCFVSDEFPTFSINTERLFPKFLQLYFARPLIWQEVEKFCTGTTKASRNRFKEPFFLGLEIPLPPLTEQRRIVVRIEALARRVAEAQSLRKEISEDLDALVSSYHVNYSAGRTIRLKDILFLDEEKETIQPDCFYPQVGVKGFGKGLFARETLTGTQTTYKWFNRLYYGAIVLSQVKGWEGAIGVCDDSLVGKFVSPEYRTFRCIPDQAIPEYLSVLFSTPYFYSRLKDLSRGVGGRRERVRPELFIELEIPMPDIQRQRKAVEIFSMFPALRAAQAETWKELSALMPSVLDRAFKGEF